MRRGEFTVGITQLWHSKNQGEQHHKAILNTATITAAMESRTKQIANAMAEANMPIPGLSLTAGTVMLNGLPFDQASDAERLRASVAIAMAGNPQLRVIRIKDGSLLDDGGIQMIADLAKENDYQVWLERVDSTGKIGIVMEDGEVVADNQVTANA